MNKEDVIIRYFNYISMDIEGIENVDFENTNKCHDWRNYVDSFISDNWKELTLREKALIKSMADSQSENENWD